MKRSIQQGRRCLSVSVLMICAQQAGAGDWTAESEFRASDADSRSLIVSVDRTVGEQGLAFVSLGETWINGSENDLDTRRQSLGGLYRFENDWRLTGFYERWGRRGDIVSDRIGASLARDYDTVGFSLTGGWRGITLKAGAPVRSNDEDNNGGPPIFVPVNSGDEEDPEAGDTIDEDYKISAINMGARVRYRPTEQWTLAAGYSYYSYDRDPRQLGARDQMERFSTSTVTLAQGFLERSLYVETRHDLGAYREFALYLSRDRSAVDGRDADSLIVSYIQPLSTAWDLRMEVGRTQTEGFDASHALGVGLTWFP
jgi:hypothetical protein